jgi:hypothetical protein
MPRTLLLLAALALAAAPAAAQQLTVTAGDRDLLNVVVAAPLPGGTPAGANVVELPGGQHSPAQITAAPLLKAKGKYLTFTLPKMAAGQSLTVRPATLNYVKAPPHFTFADKPGQSTMLLFDGRPVLDYVNAPRDAKNHFLTFKPFHHVYDPATGKVLLTSGAYPKTKEYLYPHHRGLFYGWNKISYGGRQADIWHGTNNVYSQHDKTLAQEAGEVLGRERSAISWHGPDGKAFAHETREVTAYHVPGGTLIDWASVLTTELPKVSLRGDPQHAGFHFRAAQEVAKTTNKQTYYLRPDGKGKLGATRNWDPKTKKGPTNLPWNAMSFVIGGQRYTVLRMDRPTNPKESRGSERDYGRFGDYFEYDLTPANPLKVKYRVWVQAGEMTQEQCEAMHRAFINPPKVAAK